MTTGKAAAYIPRPRNGCCLDTRPDTLPARVAGLRAAKWHNSTSDLVAGLRVAKWHNSTTVLVAGLRVAKWHNLTSVLVAELSSAK